MQALAQCKHTPKLNACMNRLTTQDRASILTVLSEGMGINAACRVTGASKNTVLKLLADVGRACQLYQDQTMRGLTIKQVQVDEIWSFIACLSGCHTRKPGSPTYGLHSRQNGVTGIASRPNTGVAPHFWPVNGHALPLGELTG